MESDTMEKAPCFVNLSKSYLLKYLHACSCIRESRSIAFVSLSHTCPRFQILPPPDSVNNIHATIITTPEEHSSPGGMEGMNDVLESALSRNPDKILHADR